MKRFPKPTEASVNSKTRWGKLSWSDRLFAALLIAGLAIRFWNLSYPLDRNLDASRDYLVARHIIVFNEYPIGSLSDVFWIFINSPLYDYLLAVFLLLYDHIIFLSMMNIILQGLSLTAVYFFAKKIFGDIVGLVAAGLLIFSQAHVIQSATAWQPYLMQPFLYLSFLLFLLSYTKKNYYLLLAGITSFLFALALHLSPASLLPFLLILIYFILRKLWPGWKPAAIALALAAGCLLLFYSLPLINLFNQEINISKSSIFSHKIFVEDLSAYLQNFSKNFFTFFQTFFPKVIYGLLLAILIIVYFLLQKDENKKKYTAAIFLAILQPMLFASFLQKEVWDYYFTPVFGLFIILIAETAVWFSLNLVKSRVVFIGALVLLFPTLSMNFSYPLRYYGFWESINTVDSAIHAIKREIIDLQKTEGYANPNFFQFIVYQNWETAHEAFFWARLEKEFNTKFTKLTNYGNGYAPTSGGPYIFVVCEVLPYGVPPPNCLNLTLKNRPNLTMIKKVHERRPFTIYLLRPI